MLLDLDNSKKKEDKKKVKVPNFTMAEQLAGSTCPQNQMKMAPLLSSRLWSFCKTLALFDYPIQFRKDNSKTQVTPQTTL